MSATLFDSKIDAGYVCVQWKSTPHLRLAITDQMEAHDACVDFTQDDVPKLRELIEALQKGLHYLET